MQLSEITETLDNAKLIQVLKTVIADADAKGNAVFLHFQKPQEDQIRSDMTNINLNKLMANVGGEAFDFETFKAAYDSDSRVKGLIQNFNEKGIEPKTQAQDQFKARGDTTKSNSVAQAAKRAVDLSPDSL